MTMDRLANALRVVEALKIQGELRTSDVMRICGVERPAAMRLLAAVRDSGVPIEHVGRGAAQKWVVTDPAWKRVGLAVGPGDAFALHVGRQLLGFVETEWHDDLRRKLKVGTSGRIAELERKLARRFVFLSEPYRRYASAEDALDQAITALVEGIELEMDYGGREAERRWDRVRPLVLVMYRRALYLLVRLGDHPNVLRLAVERIRRTGVRFDYPGDFDVDRELGRTFGIFDDHREPGPVRMRFSRAVADLVAERTWHPTARVTREPDGTALLTLTATGAELTRLALEFGSQVEVLEPAWLRDEVHSELRKALARYGPP
jgi:predicted DNA-binding transcriptional regulator YafY